MTRAASIPSRLAQSLRFDGLWWRKCVYMGSVYGPDWIKRLSPPVFAAIIFMLVRRVRQGTIDNMDHLLGQHGRWHVRMASLRTCAEFARCMAETMEQYGPHPRPVRVDLHERDLLAEALQEGRGAILLTGHLGNWDMAANRLSGYGRPISVVMAREANTTTHEYVRQVRAQAGLRIIYSDASVFSSLNVIHALRQNDIVAIQLDRPLGAGRTRLVPFFGVPAAFPSGPFVLARISGAPLIPVFVPRVGPRHYTIRLGGKFTLAGETRDSPAQDRVMEEVIRVFEQIVREHPTQWFQFTPFWPTSTASAALAAPMAYAERSERRRAP